MNLLYIAFGDDTLIHAQFSFSIYSFLNQQQFVDTINIITDKEEYYNHLKPLVNIIAITTADLKEWKGKHNYLWRIKIKAIEKLALIYPNQQILYLDADTFLFNDLKALKNNLNKGLAVMHDEEGFLSKKKTKTQRIMWQQIKGKTFGKIDMQPTDIMWNAGVIAFPNTCNNNEIKLALAICDDMCEAVPVKHFVEQYAFSIALQKMYGLTAAKDCIAHYWGTKNTWNKVINIFFLEAYFCKWDQATITQKINEIDKTSIPIYEKIKNTGVRLKALIDNLFPIKEITYLQKK